MAPLLGIFSSGQEVYAVNPCAILGDPPSDYTKVQDNTDIGCHFEPILTTPKSSASFTIDDGGAAVYDKVVASYGQTNYSSHTVKVMADGIDNYTLTLSGVKLTGPSEIRGVSSTGGATLPDNSWGYAWGSVDSDEDNLTYNSATTANLAENNVVNNSLDFSRKLVFATKFNEDVDPGVYKATATLSFTATPSTVVTWNELVYMQDMTAYACEYASTFASKKLIDIRDNNEYTVTKLEDGKCWMTDNLALTKESLKTGLSAITKYDSDVESSQTLPNASLDSFASDSLMQAIYQDNTNGMKDTFYSWCAATASSCKETLAGGGDALNAGASICPSGWILPSTQAYTNLFIASGVNTMTSEAEKVAKLMAPPYSFTLPGEIYSYGIHGVGNNGSYWTSTAEASSRAYYYYINLERTDLSTNYDTVGFSVRCIVR